MPSSTEGSTEPYTSLVTRIVQSAIDPDGTYRRAPVDATAVFLWSARIVSAMSSGCPSDRLDAGRRRTAPRLDDCDAAAEARDRRAL